jgi:hypothetical protein
VWPTPKTDIILELLKYGVHNKVIPFPVISIPVGWAFGSTRVTEL